ncbi:MAG TPA: peptidylprolyl isomerase [Gemmatimonadales bacterium]
MRRIRLASSALAILLLAARPAAAQQDEAVVGLLAGLLASTDARRPDPSLSLALRHASPAVRRQAALLAGRTGVDPAVVDLLVPALQDSSVAVRSAAAFALGLLRDARAVAPLVEFVRAASPDQQTDAHREAVTAVAKIGGEAGAQALADIIAGGAGTSTAPAVSRALFEAWRLGARAPVALLVGAAAATDPTVRRGALYSLARLRIAAAAAPLFAALQDQDADIRMVAARGISAAIVDSARLERRPVLERLRGLLAERDPRIRINALRALASFRDSSTVTAVLPLLADADVGVQVQAETTLGALGGSAAVAMLTGRVTSGGFAFRRQALLGLAEASATRGSRAAGTLVGDADWRWRRVAAEALGVARNRAQLEAQLADRDGRVVATALEALGRAVADTDAVVAHARRLIVHEDPAVRSVAADIIARRPALADVDLLVTAYRRAEGDPFNDARLSAVLALGAVARTGEEGRVAVRERFLAAVPRSEDYLVRRLAAERLADAAAVWGPVGPIATGWTDADYRDVVRRYLLPAMTGEAPPRVTIETDRGSFVVRLLPVEAPLTVAAFLRLVDQRFFDGHRWHRVVPNFVVQDGDPRGDGWGGPGFVLRDEVNPVRYGTGTMGMALSGPDTGGSQFFITHSAQPHLDGIYTVFGEVVSGAAVLAAISQGDRIRSIHR